MNDAGGNEKENENEDEDESAELLASVPRLIATDHNAVQVNLGELRICIGIAISIGIERGMEKG